MSVTAKIFLSLCALTLGACSLTGGFTSRLSDAILNQPDPQIVADGAPSFLLIIDALIAGDPNDSELLLTGAQLYSAYAGNFVESPQRSAVLAEHAFGYARRATCRKLDTLCAVLDQPFDVFAPAVEASAKPEILYALGSAWAGRIQAQPGDWLLIADLPKVRRLMERSLALDPQIDQGGPHVYLGVLDTLLPPALGGQPERAREHFEAALALSAGNNLMIKVLLARHYARLVFDQELHDRLLDEVLMSPVEAPQLTLINRLAQQQARELLADSPDYF